MKFKHYLASIADADDFIPTPRFRWVIRKNPRKTAREEAIAAEVIQQANPRENITGRFPWGPEQQMVLQQAWINPDSESPEWRDVPIEGANELCSDDDGIPIPNAVKEPGQVRGNFPQKLREVLGDNYGEPRED